MADFVPSAPPLEAGIFVNGKVHSKDELMPDLFVVTVVEV
jgi:hypothetical protein